MELLTLCHIFPQRSEEDFQAKSARVLCWLQSLLANANVSGFYLFFELNPSTPSFYLCSARFFSATSALGYTSSIPTSRQLDNLLRMFFLCSILETGSRRRRLSLGSKRRCLMAERMMREWCITKGTLVSKKLENLLPGNTMRTCSCFQYLLIIGRILVAI